MASIFISYRQADAKAWAITLGDELARAFGEHCIFLDKDALHAGNWREQIRRELKRCKVMVVVIGPRWLTIADEKNRPCIQLGNDVHRQEIALALSRSRVTVIPVLVDEASMPRPDQLPSDLRRLTDQQARRIGDTRARRMADFALLIKDIEFVGGLRPVAQSSKQNAAGRGSRPGGEQRIVGSPVEIDVSLHSPQSEKDNPLGVAESEYEVSYAATMDRGDLTIVPRVGYLDRLAGQGPIRSANYWHSPFEDAFALPSLDIKVVNNSGRTVFFTKAVLTLEKSTENDEPLPIIRADKLGYRARELTIVNDGWGKLPRVTAAFNVFPLKSEEYPDIEDLNDEVEPPFAYEVVEKPRSKGYENDLTFDVSRALAASGADIKRILKFARDGYVRWDHFDLRENPPEVFAALGPFTTNLALLKGELRYAYPRAPEGIRRVKFIAWIWLLNARRKGAPRPPTAAYSVLLPPSGGRRSIVVPIAQEIKNDDTDRFTLRIASPKSSSHRFRIRLAYGSNQSVLSSWIKLDLFMPRSAARLLGAR
jgi:hypothetical protein